MLLRGPIHNYSCLRKDSDSIITFINIFKLLNILSRMRILHVRRKSMFLITCFDSVTRAITMSTHFRTLTMVAILQEFEEDWDQIPKPSHHVSKRESKPKYECRNRNRDETTHQKENGFNKRFGVATIVVLENYGKPWN